MTRILNSEIFGLPIPDAGPVFAVALAMHVASGLTAVVVGVLAATARNDPDAIRVLDGSTCRRSAVSSPPPPSWRSFAGMKTRTCS
jgi:hypothetical protein